MAASRLSQLIGRILTFHGSMQLKITAGSMSGTTVAAICNTLLSLTFVIDYFNYTKTQYWLNKIKMSQLSDKLIEGKICELATWQEKLLIVHLLTCLVTSSQRNKNLGSFRCFEAVAKETYMYMLDKFQDDQGIFWILFDIHHQELFTFNDL